MTRVHTGRNIRLKIHEERAESARGGSSRPSEARSAGGGVRIEIIRHYWMFFSLRDAFGKNKITPRAVGAGWRKEVP